jgi:5-deoxy-glucuronate isomerase
MSQPARSLLIHPQSGPSATIQSISPQQAGWEHLHMEVRQLEPGSSWEFDTGNNELAMMILGGTCTIRAGADEWQRVGRRTDVFAGLPYALYAPPRTQLVIEAHTPCELGYGWCAAEGRYPTRLVTPEDVSVEIRGGDNVTRQINNVIPPGFPCERLVMVEVYTPGGNWSSFPPHKHDQHRVESDGTLVEADLEEVYFYRFDRPAGFAYQRIYSDDRSTDELLLCQDCDLVLVPHGYHPVVAAPGATAYYLNILAGSAQSLAASDDPHYGWIKGTYTSIDPRIPIYPIEQTQH